jgi:type VI secretion system protein ImpC
MATPPFVLGILGDFGGRRGTRELVRIDRDSFDAVMARFDVAAELAPGTLLALGSLDAFHPDSLVRSVPDTGRVPATPATARPAGVAPIPAPPARPAELLDAILAGGATPSAPGGLDAALAEFVRRAVEPSLVRSAGDDAAGSRALAERVRGDGVRALLHHPRVRALEAAWRGLFEVVSRAETGPELEIRVLDAPRDAAAAALAEATATRGGPALAAIVAGYTFGPSAEDIAALEALAAAAAAAGAPLVVDGHPGLLGLADARDLGSSDVRARLGVAPGLEGWRRFRAGPHARDVALCLPRVLLRPPYGRGGDETTFAFDEEVSVADHEGHLWGSGALAFGRVLVRGFVTDGWSFEPGAHGRLEGLPLHADRIGTEERVLPCAEVVMSDATLRAVAEQGVVPLASVRDGDEAQFVYVGTAGGTPIEFDEGVR